ILINRRVSSPSSSTVTNVLVAISAGVSKAKAAFETAGLLVGLMAEKSPPRISDVGILFALSCAVPKSQRRSYDNRKNVFPCVSGRGPLKYPPTSLRLNFDSGNVGVSGVGRKS